MTPPLGVCRRIELDIGFVLFSLVDTLPLKSSVGRVVDATGV